MAILQIPDRFLPGFNILSQLAIEDVQKICALLGSIKVGSDSRNFARLLERELNIDADKATEISEVVFSLGSFITSDEYTFEEVATHLTKSFVEESQENVDDNALKEKLFLLLSQTGPFKQTIKALSLFTDNEKTFKSAKIITDIRLVFNDDLADRNRSGLIVHRLKIEFTKNDELHEFYAALDSRDLLLLKKQIERAIEKESVMRIDYKDSIDFVDLNSNEE